MLGSLLRLWMLWLFIWSACRPSSRTLFFYRLQNTYNSLVPLRDQLTCSTSYLLSLGVRGFVQITFLSFFLVTPYGVQDLTSPTKDWCPVQQKPGVLTTGPPGKPPIFLLYVKYRAKKVDWEKQIILLLVCFISLKTLNISNYKGSTSLPKKIQVFMGAQKV